jgi:hypothetical protein
VDLDALLNSAYASEVFLEETGWMTGGSPEELEQTYADFSGRFQRWLATLGGKLGPPFATRPSNPDLADDLYLEAFELAAWQYRAGYLVLACGQHDRETPVFVSFGYREASAV